MKWMHKRIKYFRCKVCEKSVHTKTSLDSHIKAVHENERDQINGVSPMKTFKCQICQVETNIKSKLKTHNGVMHKQHKCTECNKSCTIMP